MRFDRSRTKIDSVSLLFVSPFNWLWRENLKHWIEITMRQSEDHHHGHQHVIIIDQNGKRASRFRFEVDENESDQNGECTKKDQQRYPARVRLEKREGVRSPSSIFFSPSWCNQQESYRTDWKEQNWSEQSHRWIEFPLKKKKKTIDGLFPISERTWKKESRRGSLHLSQDTGEESNRREKE